MSLTGYERLPLDSQRRLDDECTRFERDWVGPSSDRLAELLAAAPPAEASVWLTELLHIEVERARRAGMSLPVGDYLARLPAFAAAIEAVLAEHSKPLGVGDSIGKYRLVRLLGRGASGTVFEAEDSVIGRRVAVKLLTGPSAASRTVQEARTVGRLQHPSIVTVYDAGSADGVWYIAMELLSGSTADRLKANGPFAPVVATRIVADVCRGLAAAHATGLIHRDIKPANVLLSSSGVGLQPLAKLSDFGLAQAKHSGTEADTAGTPLYMAPEQFDGREVGPACDIYSLGVTYFALLTGRPPYQSARAADLQIAHETSPPPAVTTASGEILSRHSRVVARAMAKSPADRYSSADEMLADLESLLPRERARPSWGRRFSIVGVMAALMAGVVLMVPGLAKWVASVLYGKERKPVPAVVRPEWTSLFNGRDLTGWTAGELNPTTSIVTDDGPLIRLNGTAVGSIMTEREHEGYHLRMEVRWQQSGQPFSGSLRYHVTNPSPGSDTGWDEFSLAPPSIGGHQHTADRAVRLAALRVSRLAFPPSDRPPEAPPSGLSPVGASWHLIDLVCWQDVIVHGVDGKVVSTRVRSKPPAGQAFTRGRIEIRAVRGSIDVRRIDIRPVAGIPTELQSGGDG